MSEKSAEDLSTVAEQKADTASKPYDSSMFGKIDAHFHGSIETAVLGAQSGLGGSGERSAKVTRSTGLVDGTDIAALSRFVQPECFEDGVSQLAQNRMLVLCGPADTGKRSSALSLLREVTTETLYMLSPHVSVMELAEYEYETGCGYVVVDRFVDRRTKESDFEWRLARDQVVKKDCYLVVTQPLDAAERFGHMAWRAPLAEKVLRSYWQQEWSEEHATVLADVLGTVDRVRDVVGLAQQLAGGNSLEDALSHLDSRVRTAVKAWFEEHENDQAQLLEVTTLAFTVGVDERTFERALRMFREVLDKYVPPPKPRKAETAPEEAVDETRGYSDARTSWRANEFIATEEVRTEFGTRNAMTFAKPEYQRHVLTQLWQGRDVAFWDAVRHWLDLIVMKSRSYELPAARGLARLAPVTIDEVMLTLDHWALGDQGPAGQRSAVYTLCLMAQNSSLAPAALKIATEWITRGQPTHRWVGTMAFTADLGVCYPHDARRRLWQVCMQSHTVDGNVEQVFGELFGTLVRSTRNAHLVLNFLVEKGKRFMRPDARTKTRMITARMTIAVIESRDPLTKRSLVLVHLTEFPEHTDAVAQMLAGVLRHRPTRERALRALHMLLEDLARDAQNAGKRADALGEALRAHLPVSELDPLEKHFRIVAGRKKKGADIRSLVNAILNALQGRDDDDDK
jgi:hypothetical protein